jgi:hypothetical protein
MIVTTPHKEHGRRTPSREHDDREPVLGRLHALVRLMHEDVPERTFVAGDGDQRETLTRRQLHVNPSGFAVVANERVLSLGQGDFPWPVS